MSLKFYELFISAFRHTPFRYPLVYSPLQASFLTLIACLIFLKITISFTKKKQIFNNLYYNLTESLSQSVNLTKLLGLKGSNQFSKQDCTCNFTRRPQSPLNKAQLHNNVAEYLMDCAFMYWNSETVLLNPR